MSIKVYGWVPMIRMSDMRYPVYLSDFKAEYTNVSTGSFVYEEGMAEFGYYPVLDVEIPTGDVVTEGKPVQAEDGRWYKTWISRDYTDEEIADNLKREKENLIYNAKFTLENDNMNGVIVDGKVYSLEQNSLSLYHSLLKCCEYSENTEVFSILDQNREVTELLREDMISHLKYLINEYVYSHNAMCNYVKSVNVVSKLEDLPAVPETFRTI